jgi:hypothetical protein
MFIDPDHIYFPSSVGAKCEMSLLRSLKAKLRDFYKHLAPTEPDSEGAKY